jgi:hypothetical protein
MLMRCRGRWWLYLLFPLVLRMQFSFLFFMQVCIAERGKSKFATLVTNARDLISREITVYLGSIAANNTLVCDLSVETIAFFQGKSFRFQYFDAESSSAASIMS